MRIRPLFKWFGSKWSSARRYPPPRFETIIEPYAGSAGYALNYVEKRVIIYDSNPNVWALWEWLINYASRNPCAVLEIPVGVPIGTDIRTLGLTTGQELLLKHWQRTNNYGECWTISPWGDKPGQWTASTRARVADEVQWIKHWALLNNGPPPYMAATYFIDPPYQFNYRYGCDFDWRAVTDMVSALPPEAQIIACEAVCPKTGTVPNYLPFEPSHSQVTSRRKPTNNHHSKELIYTR